MFVRTMIFDFDGTIADTFHAVIDVLNQLSDEFGYRRADPDEMAVLTSLGLRELADRVGLAWHRLPALAVRVRKEMSRQMHGIAPCRGVVPVLASMRAQGTRIGILTSNHRDNVDRFLANQPELTFDFISTGSGLFSKETRLKRLLATQRLALAETCYVGDEVRDVEAARAVGMRSVGVTWGFSSPQLLAASKPDHLIADPNELLGLVLTR
jgi:phosphoglycolate phosphatase